MNKRKILIEILIFLLFIILTPIMLLPFSLNINSSVIDEGDTLINLWTLSWGTHSLLTDPVNYFNANIFYPERLTLAYSEHQYSTVLIFTPLFLIFRNQVIAYNLTFMLSFALSGYFMYLFVRYVTKNRIAGILSGLFFAFFPYRYHQLPRSQLLSIYWMPLSLLWLFKLFEKPDFKRSLLFALFTSLSILASFYLGFQLLFLLIVMLIFIFFTTRKEFVKKMFFLVISILIICLIFLPFVIPYLEISKEFPDFNRSIETTIGYSAEISSFLQFFESNLLFSRILKNHLNGILVPGAGFFPGFTILFLSFLGVIFIRRKTTGFDRDNMWMNISRFGFITVLLFSVLMMLGPVLKSASFPEIRLPYYYFYKYFPGFKSMRVPSRFVISTMLSLSVLSGLGFNWLQGFVKKIKYKWVFTSIPIIFCVLIIFENFNYPIDLEKMDIKGKLPISYELISRSKCQEIVFDPTNAGPLSNYYSTYHFKDVLGGESGYISNFYSELNEIISDSKNPESYDYLEGTGVTKIVLNMNYFHPRDAKRVEDILSSKYLPSRIEEFNGYRLVNVNDCEELVSFIDTPLFIDGGIREVNFLKDIKSEFKNFIIFSDFNENYDLSSRIEGFKNIPIVSAAKGVGYACEYDTSVAYENAAPNEVIKWWITIKNTGDEIWSNTGHHPIKLSYHLLDFHSEMETSTGGYVFELSHPVMPGESISVFMEFNAPAKEGKYLLSLDLLKEGKFWFSENGNSVLKIPLFIGQKEMPPIMNDTYKVDFNPGLTGLSGDGYFYIIDPENLKYELSLDESNRVSIFFRLNKGEQFQLLSMDIDGKGYQVKQLNINGYYFYIVDKIFLNKGKHIISLAEKIENKRTILVVLNKPYDKNWRLYINNELQKNHIKAGFFKNGWLIEEKGKLKLDFRYVSNWEYLFYLSNFIIVACILFPVGHFYISFIKNKKVKK